MVLRVGCVPEHFSAPLMYAVDNGMFLDERIELVECKLGTGDMVKRVVAGELDVAISWAVSVKQDSKYCSLDDLAFGATFGISRKGSGSQVMAQYASSQYEWKEPQFAVLGDVNGLIEGVQTSQADAFLWERTTMQRHYSRQQVRYLGTVRPPWPAFSLAALSPLISDHKRVVGFLEWVQKAIEDFMGERRIEYVCERLGYGEEDVKGWLEYVRFSAGEVDCGKIDKVLKALEKAGVVKDLAVSDVVLKP
ncbi:hypothetical protein LPJ78_003859 [Coemansia sp. RSA 989]|nr:hypothetical protein LPJ78_003859 [Coemansia sp. RSA 989]KAJ1871522.1 hypothetical protein LPJ55_003821 [Coemansia sp. RSA 990]KAJ2631681.1 hypothetical protein H4R22_001806 [Coemansia sp. RSA 1290]KAJ2647008.1 hypothetical protein IWW40_005002 [Coemansia sp. RSA 1250]KAJ2668824.1 hypothetical protein IWW42_004960 [Coemansia sp. RSA 1085]